VTKFQLIDQIREQFPEPDSKGWSVSPPFRGAAYLLSLPCWNRNYRPLPRNSVYLRCNSPLPRLPHSATFFTVTQGVSKGARFAAPLIRRADSFTCPRRFHFRKSTAPPCGAGAGSRCSNPHLSGVSLCVETGSPPDKSFPRSSCDFFFKSYGISDLSASVALPTFPVADNMPSGPPPLLLSDKSPNIFPRPPLLPEVVSPGLWFPRDHCALVFFPRSPINISGRFLAPVTFFLDRPFSFCRV